MKFTWEESDIKRDDVVGILAEKGDEIIIVNTQGCTSLRDGHRWMKNKTKAEITQHLNKNGFTPIVNFVNAYDCVKRT